MDDYPLWFRLIAAAVVVAVFLWSLVYKPRGRQ